MLYEYMRVFKYDGVSFTDLSLDNQDNSATLDAALLTTDYIYVGQYFPFNNIYLNMDTANTNTAKIKVEYYNREPATNGWASTVDDLDATSTGGATLGKSGLLQYEPDRDEVWLDIFDTSEEKVATELTALTIYNLYWMRISVDADMSVGTLLKEITYAFTKTQELIALDVEIGNYFAAFGAGKTSYEDEIITASKLVLNDMKLRNILGDRGRLLRMDDVWMLTNWKALELIYGNLGTAYKDQAGMALKKYEELIISKRLTLDQNRNARVEKSEIRASFRSLHR